MVDRHILSSQPVYVTTYLVPRFSCIKFFIEPVASYYRIEEIQRKLRAAPLTQPMSSRGLMKRGSLKVDPPSSPAKKSNLKTVAVASTNHLLLALDMWPSTTATLDPPHPPIRDPRLVPKDIQPLKTAAGPQQLQ